MFCPECGFDAQEARFCPECGAGLDRFRSSIDDDFDDAPRREARPAARTTGELRGKRSGGSRPPARGPRPVSYTHLRAHETRHDLVCRLLLEKKKKKQAGKSRK